MTRSTLQRTLRRICAVLIIVLGIPFLARIADHMPSLGAWGVSAGLKYLRDMSLLIATGDVAYVANVYQKRASFIEALKVRNALGNSDGSADSVSV